VLQVEERAQRARAAAVKPAAGVAARDDGGATWRSREGSSAGWEAAGRVQERHVARRKAARGQLGLGKVSAKAARSRAQAEQRRGS
jgi:hypothetical protein